jgi:hypothetical protein
LTFSKITLDSWQFHINFRISWSISPLLFPPFFFT